MQGVSYFSAVRVNQRGELAFSAREFRAHSPDWGTPAL
jgi:hypothetical protein